MKRQCGICNAVMKSFRIMKQLSGICNAAMKSFRIMKQLSGICNAAWNFAEFLILQWDEKKSKK